MIANCGSDERGQYHGGKAGDNNGKEWVVKPWYRYSSGWNFVARHPDIKVGVLLADLARKAANNDKIGYDQYERTSYWNQLKSVNYDPAAIKTACEADCSSGIAANVKAAGFILKDDKLKSVSIDMYTGNAESQLRNAGFKILKDAKYLTSDANLQPGDILVNIKHHMTTNLDYGANVPKQNVAVPTSKSATTTSATPVPKSKEDIVNEVIAGKWGVGIDRKKALEAAGYDYYDIQFEVNKALKSTNVSPTEKVVVYRVVVTSFLRVRKKPSTDSEIVKVLYNGALINVKNISNGWAELSDGNYVSAEWIVKA